MDYMYEEDPGQTESAERAAKLDSLGRAISERRAEAIKARSSSGIEDEWLEDEEFYEGIDDANRSDMKAWGSKPPGRIAAEGNDTSSNIFLNITRSYCDSAGASLADMLLPTDDSAWQITNTPVPELIQFSKGKIPEDVKGQIQSEAQAVSDDPAFAEETEARLVDKVKTLMQEAKGKAEAAQKRIEDWHVECQYHAQVRKVIEDAARIGSGVLKGPIPAKKRIIAYIDGEIQIDEQIKPISKRIDYRNLYPAEGCGESIHNGSYIFERDDITSKQLRELIGVPGYDESQIIAVLEEGPTEAGREHQPVDEMKRGETKTLFEIWYFYGDIEQEDLDAAGCGCGEAEDGMGEAVEKDGGAIPGNIVMVNNRVIKAVESHLDTGEFPYDVMVWQTRRGMPWGVGVARQIRTPQRMINGAARNLMDNAGLAGGPMWAFKPGILSPIDGVAELAPRKGWIADEDADAEDVSKAFTYFKLDMCVPELQSIIQLGLKMAEDVTGLPAIMQGQMGARRVETLGQTEILNNNANIVRRRIARLFDDLVTEPHVRRYYSYLLQYGEDEEKGEFVIDARGSSNLVERTIQKEKTVELLNLAQNPIYKLDPIKVAREYLRSEKFDPKNFEYDDEEWQQIVANMSQPQEAVDPREAIAQMSAEVKMQMQDKDLAHKEKIKQAELEADERIEGIRASLKQGITEFMEEMETERAEMKYKGDKDIQFDALKTRLNETVMKLTTTKQLAKPTAANLPTPIVEPPQRANRGESYQQ